MDATELGAKRGRKYLKINSLEMLASLTFTEYCALGRVDASKHYQTRKAREAYALGWFAVGKQFLTLFKPEDSDPFVVERKMSHLYTHLEGTKEELATLFAYRPDNIAFQTCLLHVQGDIEKAMSDIKDAYQQMKKLSEQ